MMFNQDNSKVIVTGGNGNIGSYIIEKLVTDYRNITVVSVDNFYNGDLKNLINASNIAKNNFNKLVELNIDITNFLKLELVFSKYKPNYVYHQASMLTLDSEQDKRRAVEVNVLGTTNIFDLCKKYGVKKIVAASSASVFGDPDYIPVDESHHFNNCELVYGLTKIMCENIAKSYMRENIDITMLRYFNVYSPRQSSKNFYVQIVIGVRNMRMTNLSEYITLLKIL